MFKTKKENILIIGSLLMAIGVLFGAFGAHSLNNILIENGRLDNFQTATQYLFYHSIGILFIGILYKTEKPSKKLRISFYLMFLGIVFFCGSLYLLSITNITLLGAITPIGGILFVIGWIYLALSCKDSKF